MKITILIILFSNLLLSQSNIGYDEIGHNNFGKEFYLSVPPNLSIENQSHNEFVNFIFFSPFDANVIIEVASRGFRKELKLKANESNGLKININTIQPLIKTGMIDLFYDIEIKNAATIIKSDYPISVVVLSDFENTSDSYLAIPKENLGTEYVVSSYNDVSNRYSGFKTLKSNSMIIATEDDTEVEFFYPAENTKFEVRGLKVSGNTFKRTLQKGDVWLLSSVMSNDDLSNARIKSTKAISVISSNQCANIPIDNNWCDFIMNMEIPTQYWGKSYIISKFDFKKYSPIIRVYAAENNTKVYQNGELIGEIKDIYSKDEKSFIELFRPLDNYFQPFILSSDKAIMVTSYNTGDAEDQKIDPNGGPFMMSLPSIESMTKYTSISSPNFPQDVSFNNNYVNLLFELDESNNIPNSFEIGYLSGNSFNWYKIKDNTNIKSAQKINIPYNNKTYGVVNFKLPNNGHFKLRSDYNFTLVNYGVNEFKSYGYPGNINLVMNEGVDTIAPVIKWTVTCDSKIEGEIIETNLKGNLLKPDYNMNNMVVIDKSVNPAKFTIDILDEKKAASGTIKVWDVYGNNSDAKIIYKPQQIELSKNSFIINSKSNVENRFAFEIINNSEKEFHLNHLYSDDNNIKFFIDGLEFVSNTHIINKNSKLKAIGSYISKNDTVFNTKIYIGDDCLIQDLGEVRINISSPIIEVSDITFQDAIVGQEQIKTFSIYNKSKVDLTLTGVIFPNIYDFEVFGLPLISELNKVVIAPEQSLTAYVKVISKKIGNLSDSIKFISDAELLDSVCYINSTILEPGLIVNSYNFGRKEINHVNKVISPYISDTLKISNFGKATIEIKDLNIINYKNKDAFLINYNDIIGKKLKSNEELSFLIGFLPENVGEHSLELEFVLDDNIKTTSTLKLAGFGTQAKLAFEDTLDLGKVQINNDFKVETFEILNTSDNWEYFNKLNEYSLEYDKNLATQMGFVITSSSPNEIEVGQVNKYFITFTPKSLGLHVLPVEIISNATGKNTFYLKGTGIQSKLFIENLDIVAKACQDEKDTLFVKLRNDGTSDINLEPLRFEPILPEFKFLDPTFSLNEFNLEVNKTIEIPIEFQSFGYNKDIKLIVKEKKSLVSNEIVITGINKLYDNVFEIIPLKQSVEVSKPALSSVVLEQNPELIDANLKDLSLVITYDPSILNLQQNSIKVGNQISDNYIVDNISEIENGKVKFDLISLNQEKITQGGELVSFIFKTYLSNKEENYSNVNIDLISKTTQCVNFQTENPQVIETILNCTDDFRKIESNVTPFFIDKISPNPLDKNIKLTYAIPFNSNVSINLVDLNGNVVKSYINLFQNKGYYEFELNIDNLANGQYFLRIISGSIIENLPLLINK